METLSAFIGFAGFIVLVIGFINFRKYKKDGGDKGHFKKLFMVGVALMIVGGIFSPNDIDINASDAQTKESDVQTKDVEAVKDEKDSNKEKTEEEEKEDEQSRSEIWEETKPKLLGHYAENNVVDIKTDSNHRVFNVYITNVMKLLDKNEKQYYVDELGNLLSQDLDIAFSESNTWVEFYYEDGSKMASRRMGGGYKIKD